VDDIVLSKAIIESYYQEILEALESDVIICGAGPSGLCASCFLAKEGFKVVVFERALRPGVEPAFFHFFSPLFISQLRAVHIPFELHSIIKFVSP